MTCDELREGYELYAMGVLDEPERAELREHLNSGCQVCTGGVKDARQFVSYLAGAAPSVSPSPRLRKRVQAAVGVDRKPWGWIVAWGAVTALLAIGLLRFGMRENERARELTVARFENQRQAAELARLGQALSLLNSPATRQVVFGEGAPKPPRGRVFIHPEKGVLLFASNLPPAPAGKIYEMWVIPKSGNPAPAGVFQSDIFGNALYVRPGAVPIGTTSAIAVTLEAAGGAAQPTSTPIIVAPLGD